MKNYGKGLRIVLVVACAGLLLLSTGLAMARYDGGYVVQEGTLAGGGYRLTSLAQPAPDTIGGGGYQLQGSTGSTGSGSGCCCLYLPCILRQP